MPLAVMTDDGTSSSQTDVRLCVPYSVRSVKFGWFLIVKSVIVAGRCTLFKLPPTGKDTPLTFVLSKYASSMLVQLERSMIGVAFSPVPRWLQFLASMYVRSRLLPTFMPSSFSFEYEASADPICSL